MKRDLNLVREILLWAEDHKDAKIHEKPPIKDYTDAQIYYHIHIMSQAGLVYALESTEMSRNPQVTLVSVTWAGHDFLSAARDDVLWKKAMKTVLKEGASFTFDYVKNWLRENIDQIPQIPPIV
ncbi:DUF2513 domain-containing protein [Nitrosomonas sp.]|uniref:DUF2513 domain-containing protein n=1 Tax=Nitrosomonas sp. TaxID=42353 RepID=UPI0025E1F9CC|nr:DUF2513 domain-containing protein [Nitrosomonas sp.]MBY0483463.1 DUF2513 domain-containing protein [Nitrosomonas sp.]